MLNNLYAAEEKLSSLWQQIANGWRRAVGAGGLQPAALDKALLTLRRQAAVLAEYIATRLVAWDLRSELGGNLYLPSAREPPQQMHNLFPLISEKSSELVRLVSPTKAANVAEAVLRASLTGLERVLLSGSGRSFTQEDGEALEEDLQALN